MTIFEISLYAILGVIMFISDIVMEALPNIHILAMFIVTFTVVYRVKALVPIYVYVFLQGLYSGFALWWVPYLYVWVVLWCIAMLLPRNMKPIRAVVTYALVCGLHGLLFGVLYAPMQIILFGMEWNQLVPWIIAGLPFDVIHCVSNVFSGTLVLGLVRILTKLPGAIPIKTKRVKGNEHQ